MIQQIDMNHRLFSQLSQKMHCHVTDTLGSTFKEVKKQPYRLENFLNILNISKILGIPLPVSRD